MSAATFATWGMLLASVVMDAGGLFLVKAGTFVALGVALFALAPFAFAIALSRMALTVAYPVQVGLNFACVAVLSAAFLGESMTPGRIGGIVLVAAGCLVVGRG